MKTIKWTFVVLTFIMFTLNSCKKSSQKPFPGNSVSFNFSGKAYSTSNIRAVDSAGTFQLIGIIGNTSNINIGILNQLKAGTSYNLISTNRGGGINLVLSTDLYFANVGTITVTSLTSTTISGTFNFTGSSLAGDPVTCTDGVFNATYTTKP